GGTGWGGPGGVWSWSRCPRRRTRSGTWPSSISTTPRGARWWNERRRPGGPPVGHLLELNDQDDRDRGWCRIGQGRGGHNVDLDGHDLRPLGDPDLRALDGPDLRPLGDPDLRGPRHARSGKPFHG